MKRHTYYVYIVSNASKLLYTGMSSNPRTRVWQHKNKTFKGYTSHFQYCRLVYWESYDNVRKAIDREKQINLIEAVNRN